MTQLPYPVSSPALIAARPFGSTRRGGRVHGQDVRRPRWRRRHFSDRCIVELPGDWIRPCCSARSSPWRPARALVESG